MAFTLTTVLTLPEHLSALTLSAQLIDTAGANVGSAVASGFVNVGGGQYLWHYASYPDGFRGAVKFTRTDTSSVVACVAINPEEGEQVGLIRTILTGITNLAAWLRALARKSAPDATALSEINTGGGTYDAATDSLEAAAESLAGAVTVTISQAALAAATLGAEVGTISLRRGDTFSRQLTGLGSLAGRSKLWFTVKAQHEDADSAAKVQITEAGGLVILNGAAGTSGDGSLTVDDAAAGDITLALEPEASAALAVSVLWRYDVQMLAGTVVTTLAEGNFRVEPDITQSVS